MRQRRQQRGKAPEGWRSPRPGGIIALLLLALLPEWHLARAANVVFTFQSSDSSVQAARGFCLYPIGGPFTNAARAIITRDRVCVTTGTNGSVTISNVYGWTYRSELQGTYAVTTNFYTFPVTNGTISADLYTGSPTNGPALAYSSAQSDSNYVAKAGSTMTGGLVNNSTGALGGFIGNGGNLTNLSAANLAGQVPSDALTNAIVRTNGSGTNIFIYGPFSNTPSLTIGSNSFIQVRTPMSPFSAGLSLDHSNIFIGVGIFGAQLTGTGGWIAMPDRAGLNWKDGSSIWGWANHGVNGGELQINGGPNIGFQPGTGIPGWPAVAQMGASIPTHEYFRWQFDDSPTAGNPLGHSKVMEWVSRTYPNNNMHFISAVSRAEHTNDSGFAVLEFFAGERLWLNPSTDYQPPDQPATFIFEMGTNGIRVPQSVTANDGTFTNGINATSGTLTNVNVIQTNFVITPQNVGYTSGLRVAGPSPFFIDDTIRFIDTGSVLARDVPTWTTQAVVTVKVIYAGTGTFRQTNRIRSFYHWNGGSTANAADTDYAVNLVPYMNTFSWTNNWIVTNAPKTIRFTLGDNPTNSASSYFLRGIVQCTGASYYVETTP